MGSRLITVCLTSVLVIFFLGSCHRNDSSFWFLVVSDTHYGKADRQVNRMTIEAMNRLPGTPLTDTCTTLIGTPMGVIHCGDILDGPSDSAFRLFEEDYGLTGEGLLRFPVYETFGNHDGGFEEAVRQGMIRRNPSRPNLAGISENGLHYSWDWKGVHFVNLNAYPGNDWIDTCGWCHYFHHPFREPLYSRDFLKQDLAAMVGSSGRPVVLVQHYGWDGFSQLWWTQPDRDSLWEVIQPYNVIGIFQGHCHAVEQFDFHGIPVWSAGSTQHGDQPGDILAVRYHEGRLSVVNKRPTPESR